MLRRRVRQSLLQHQCRMRHRCHPHHHRWTQFRWHRHPFHLLRHRQESMMLCVCFETLIVAHWQDEQIVTMQRMLQEGLMTANVFDIICIISFIYYKYKCIYYNIWLSPNGEHTNNSYNSVYCQAYLYRLYMYAHLKRLQAQAMMVHQGDQMMMMTHGNVHAQTSKCR